MGLARIASGLLAWLCAFAARAQLAPLLAGNEPDPASPISVDPNAFPAPDLHAREWFGYASPWTPAMLGAALILLAAIIGKAAPRKRRRIRRATILFMLYVTTFLVAAALQSLHAEGWSRRTWFLCGLFEVLVVIDLVAILLFDLIMLTLRIEIANIVHDLSLGAAYLLALVGMLHREGVHVTSIIATSAVVTVVLGLSLQATLNNVLGGIALQLDDSIHVGDWLQLPDGQQGKVKAIRWRHTVVETRNWDTIIVPNASLLSDHIMILGEREDQPRQHRMWLYFNVDFRFSPEEVINVVDQALQGTPIPDVAAFPPPHCICMDFAKENGDSFARYAIRYWLTDLSRDDPTSSAVRVRLYLALKRAGLPLALPGTAVFVSKDDPEHAQRKRERELSHRVVALEQVEMFASISGEERAKLAEGMRLAPFARGEIITRQDSAAHWLYVLTRGEVEVRLRVSSGVEQLVARLNAPNVFGEMGVMTGEKRTSTVVAASEVECYRIDKDVFKAVVGHRNDLAEAISTVMAKRRVELAAVREHLDAEQKRRRVGEEKKKMLESIRVFFGLDDGPSA